MGIWLLLGYGLFVGSLVNVLIYRLPRGMGWVKGRSHCPHCKKILRWYDLVPVLSWIWLKGKCRNCRKPISVLNPIVELVNAVVWGYVGYGGSVGFKLAGIGELGWSGVNLIHLIAALILSSTLLVILVVDWEHYVIPDEMTVTMLAVGAVLSILEGMGGGPLLHLGFEGQGGMWKERLIAVAASGLMFWGLHKLTKGKGMGWGDVKLVPVMGLILGRFVVVGLFAAFLLGSVVGIGLLLAGRKKFGQPVPFGPFLVGGMIIALVFGRQALDWYVGGMI